MADTDKPAAEPEPELELEPEAPPPPPAKSRASAAAASGKVKLTSPSGRKVTVGAELAARLKATGYKAAR